MSSPTTNSAASTSNALTMPPPPADDELPNTESEQSLTARVIERYSGGPPPPNWLYYPSYMVHDFRSLSNTERDNRERSGLNSLPESRTPFKLGKSSGWKMLVRAVLMGSPRQKLTLNEIKVVLNTRFPGLIEGMDSDNVIRHTLSFQTDFSVKDRHWRIESHGSAKYKQSTKAKGKRLGRPAKKISADASHPFSIITFPAQADQSSSANEVRQLPSIDQLMQSANINMHQSVSTVSHDIFGCRGLMDVMDQARERELTDLKMMAERWGL